MSLDAIDPDQLDAPFGNLRTVRGFLIKLWPWHWLNDCFDGKIRGGDIDFEVERHGHLLAIEGKSPNEEIGFAQGKLWSEKAKLLCPLCKRPSYTVVFLWGQPGQPARMSVYRNGRWSVSSSSASRARVKRYARAWFQYAQQVHGFTKEVVCCS